MSIPNRIILIESTTTHKESFSELLQCYPIECIKEDACHSLNILREQRVDLVLVDIDNQMPEKSISLASKIKEMLNSPLVMIGERNLDQEIQNMILQLIPYGFVFKPFSPQHVDIALQLAYKNYIEDQKKQSIFKQETVAGVIRINQNYTYGTVRKTLYKDGSAVKLNPRQQRLIDSLCRNINEVVSYATLSYEIWGEIRDQGSVFRTLVYTVRKMLPDLPIEACSKEGYILRRGD